MEFLKQVNKAQYFLKNYIQTKKIKRPEELQKSELNSVIVAKLME